MTHKQPFAGRGPSADCGRRAGRNRSGRVLPERAPQVVLLPRTQLGRTLGPALAQELSGGLCGLAADLAVDPIYQRVVAHQPVLEDAARQVVSIVAAPAVAVVDTALLPAAFNEPWRSGKSEETGLAWAEPVTYPQVDLAAAPLTLRNAPVIVAAGLGLQDEAGFALAGKLATALGGVVAGDVGALDAGWITEEQVVGLTGYSVAPKLYLALGIEGGTSQFMATADAGCIVAVQPDANAPFVRVADYNIIADPAEFAAALLAELGQLIRCVRSCRGGFTVQRSCAIRQDAARRIGRAQTKIFAGRTPYTGLMIALTRLRG